MIISSISFTAMNLLVKYLNGFSAYQLVFFRSIGTLFFTIPYLKHHKISFRGNQRMLLVFRGVSGMLSMSLFFMSVTYLPIGSAVALRYLSPIFAMILAVFFLKEQVKLLQWICIVITFFGVLLIKEFSANISSIGLLLALLSAFFSGIVYVIINKIGAKDHPVVIINYFMCIAAIVGFIFSVFNWDKTPNSIELLILLSLGVFGYYGQLFMTKSFQAQATNKIVALKYIEVIFTMIIAVIWFDEMYTSISLLGTAMILSGLVVMMVFKTKKP